MFSKEVKKVLIDITDKKEVENYEIYFHFNNVQIVEQSKLNDKYILVSYLELN